MSEKIEINTLITKHENKCKGCRFDMIDVEDPLWEYGYPLKRVLIDNQTGETYDEVGKVVSLLNELVTKCHKLDGELEESSAFIIEQREENEQLKEEFKIAVDEMIIDYKKLEKENEKLIQKKCLPCELVNLQTRGIDKLQKENEQLRKELNDCEKFRYQVFKRMEELNDE